MVEPPGELARQQLGAVSLGDVGSVRAGRDAVEVHELLEPMGLGVGQRHHEVAALRVADDADRLVDDGVEHGDRVAHVGVPRVEERMIGVAVPAHVPRDDAPAIAERAMLLVPHVPGRAVAVAEQHGRPRAGDLVVDLDAVQSHFHRAHLAPVHCSPALDRSDGAF